MGRSIATLGVPGLLGRASNAIALLSDTFTRANENSLSTAETGQAYGSRNKDLGGAITIGVSSNKAYLRTGTDDAAYADSGAANFDATAVVTLGSNAAHRVAGMCLKYVDSDNYALAYLTRLTTAATAVRLEASIGGSLTTMVYQPSYTLLNNTSYTLRVVCVGSDIQVLVDGALVLSYTWTAPQYTAIGASGKIGPYFKLSDTGSRFDNLGVVSASVLPF